MIPPFQRFLDEQRDIVWRFAVASVGRQEADDVFQETFLAAMKAYPRLRSGRNLLVRLVPDFRISAAEVEADVELPISSIPR